jgi:cytochrome c553
MRRRRQPPGKKVKPNSDVILHAAVTHWWSLALGLAAVAHWSTCAGAQSARLAEHIRICGTCHGEDGNSRMSNIPSLAGQPEFFVFNQLFLMRENVRRIEVMMPLVRDLNDKDLDGLSKHFAGLPARASDEPTDRKLVERGAALAAARRCGSCHLPTLAGQDQMPRLAKQRIDYLIFSLTAIRDGTRTGADTLMSASVAGLSDADLAALAHYSASR